MSELGWNAASEIIISDVKYLKVPKVPNLLRNHSSETGVPVTLFVEENSSERGGVTYGWGQRATEVVELHPYIGNSRQLR